MLNRMSSRELTEWMVYYDLEPFGEERDDYRHAMVATVIANRHRNKREQVHKIQEFLIMKPHVDEGISDEDLLAKLAPFSAKDHG